MELYLLALVIVILLESGFIFYMYSMFYKERKQLLDRIMAKSFIEYTNSEIANIEILKPKKEENNYPKVRI